MKSLRRVGITESRVDLPVVLVLEVSLLSGEIHDVASAFVTATEIRFEVASPLL